ncbi:Gldg family protein [Acaryochloris sp. IP29b_bin.148]|uniref:GldG family protein n=1 Tax=Acaryochloris sp. IP29b_bin.148 TaxID=2969218 RepID=UPI00261B03AF|nr:Gldg family protein [Acaryochloris sp. IP29b_bin.148]
MTQVLSKILKLLSWFGLAVVIAGFTAGLVSGQWLSLPLGVMITGTILMGLSFLWRWQTGADTSEQGWWRWRSTQSGTNAFISTLAVLVILGLINFMAVRFSYRVDFTEQKTFSLAPQTLNVLSSLQKPVEVLVFIGNDSSASGTQSQVVLQNQLLLKEYQRQQPNFFKFRFVDPQAEPGLARKHGIRNLGDISLVSGQRMKLLSSGLSEVTLTPAIALLTHNREAKAYVIQGHNEVPLSGFTESLAGVVNQLKLEGITVESLNLSLQRAIPKDADVLILAGPKLPLLEAEITLIDAFLKQGGNLFLMLDPEVEVGLKPTLKSIGIELDGRLIVDPKHVRLAWPAAADYGDHPITQSFNQKFSFFPFVQAIDIQEQPGQQVFKLLQTSEETWAESDLTDQQIRFNPESDRKGPLTIGVAIKRSISAPPADQAESSGAEKSEAPESEANPTPESKPSPSKPESPESTPAPTESKPSEPASTESVPPPSSAEDLQPDITGEAARIVVIGDSDFAKDDPYFDQTVNRDIFVNAVSWLIADGDDPTLSIRPKTVIQRSLNISQSMRDLLSFLGVAVLPLLAFLTAAALWWQRR